MGLFKSKEEKEAEKQAKMKQWLSDRDLDELSEEDYKQVNRIRTQLWGTGMMGALNGFGGSEKDFLFQLQNLTAGIAEQNWLLIKQNDKLIKQNNEIINLLKDKNN